MTKKIDKMGMRCSDTAEIFFEDVRVPAKNIIGDEGMGFTYQMLQVLLILPLIILSHFLLPSLFYLPKLIVNWEDIIKNFSCQNLSIRLVEAE